MPFMMKINSSDLLRIHTPRNLNWKQSIKKHMSLFLTLTSLSQISFSYMSSLKKRDKFPFFTVTMPHLSSNSSIFHGSLYWKLLSTAKCALLFSDFTPEASEPYSRMVLQGDNTEQLQNHPKRMFQKYSTGLLEYNITFTKLWNSILTNWSTFLLLLLLLLYYYYHLYQITYSLNDGRWKFFLLYKCNIFCIYNSLCEHSYI